MNFIIKRLGISVLAMSFMVASPAVQLAEGSPPITKLEHPVSSNSRNNFSEPTGKLTRVQVINLVLQNNQNLAAFNFQIEAGESAAMQAGLWQNPELDIEVENFAGDDDMSSFDAAETTVAVSQLVPLGGKREKRQRIAGFDTKIIKQEYREGRLNLLADADRAFIAVLANQQRLRLAGEQERLAQEVFSAVQARVEAGKVSPVEETKAGVLLATTRISRQKAQRDLAVNRKNLVSFWGSNSAVFSEAVGDFDVLSKTIMDQNNLTDLIHQHPKIKKRALQIERAKAKVLLARAERLPDVTLSGGVRQFEETNDTAFVAGVSIPLMFFNRNQGGISEAGHNVSKAKASLAAAKINIRTELDNVLQDLQILESEAKSLKNDVLPGANTVFAAVREGFKQGKFDYLEVLDAQKTLFEITRSHIDAIESYQLAMIEVKRLAGLFE